MHHQDHISDSSGCAGAVLALSPRGCQGLCQRLFAPHFRPAAPLNLVALHYRRGAVRLLRLPGLRVCVVTAPPKLNGTDEIP